MKLQTKENLAGYSFLALKLHRIHCIQIDTAGSGTRIKRNKMEFCIRFKNMEFVGLDNYARLLHDDVFIRSLINTLIYGVVLVPVAIFWHWYCGHPE